MITYEFSGTQKFRFNNFTSAIASGLKFRVIPRQFLIGIRHVVNFGQYVARANKRDLHSIADLKSQRVIET
jgi:Tfp pilus assembly pilus retraction ATPase PilT